MRRKLDEAQRQAQLADFRHKLLMAGFSTFAEKGYRGATVRDIVRKTGNSVNAISLVFGSKEKLALAVIDKLKETVVLPVARAAVEIDSDAAWRAAVRRFVQEVVALFSAKEEPNRHLAALYRHESAHLHDKKVTLHAEIIRPIFRRLESLIALGVASRDATEVRLWTLALWNNVIACALKHPDVLAEDVPLGADPERFRATAIDFMVEKCIRDLRFTPSA